MISMPPMYSIYIFSILKDRGCEVDYSRNVNKVNLNDYDYIIMTSSIICHETEIKVLKKLLIGQQSFCYRHFANTLKSKYNSKYSYVVPWSEFFFLKLELKNLILIDISTRKKSF